GVVWLVRRRSASVLVPWRSLVLILLIAILAAVLVWQVGPLKERVLTSFGRDDTGLSFRRLAWGSTLKMISRESVLGIGCGNFAAFYPRYRTSEERALFPQRRFVRNPHNSYLLAAAEGGPLGLAAIIFFVLAALRLALARVRSDRGGGDIFDAALAVGIIATLLHTAVSFNLEKPVSAFYFWAFAGLLSIQPRLGGGIDRGSISVLGRSVMIGLSALIVALMAAVLVADLREINASIHAPRGAQHKRQGDLPGAEQELKTAVELWPESPNYHYLLAKVLLQNGDLQGAEAENRRALVYWPHFRDTLLDIGMIKWQQGKLAEAERYVLMSLDVDPAFARARIALGNLYTLEGNYAEAIREYKRALERPFSRERAYYHIAVAEAARGRTDVAMESIESALLMRDGFLGRDMQMTARADDLLRKYLRPGEKTFRVVARDADMQEVWEGRERGLAVLSETRPRILVLKEPDGVAIEVSEDGERIAFRFRRVLEASFYSIVIDEDDGRTMSFDASADSELHAQVYAFYGQLLSSLDRPIEAEAMCREALRLDPENNLARKLLIRSD
ncbi:MAG: tetratricopeptide repeat protein, partial [Candidatus Coatesbacteria bacterium]|nr:tetratricopeptide repeat protein [Candidatus Coatesbacteria bacterium]